VDILREALANVPADRNTVEFVRPLDQASAEVLVRWLLGHVGPAVVESILLGCLGEALSEVPVSRMPN
jgi:hypothetical protein